MMHWWQRVLTVVGQTYRMMVLSRGFVTITFVMPLFFAGITLTGVVLAVLLIVSVAPLPPRTPVALVGLPPQLADVDLPIGLFTKYVIYPDEAAAEQALAADVIQAYYLFAEDYWETGDVLLVYDGPLSGWLTIEFTSWMDEAVSNLAPEAIWIRYTDGPQIERQTLSGEAAFTADDFALWVMVFGVIYLVRLGSSATSGFLYDSIASESHDRTIEIMLSGMTRMQFLVGKFSGLTLGGLTMILIWAVLVLGGVWVAEGVIGSDLLALLFGWRYIGTLLLFLLGAFVLDHLIAAAAGLLRTSGGAGPQLISVVTTVVGIGLLYAMAIAPANPDSAFAVVASLFPLTAPVVMPIRLVASSVPGWQVALAHGLLWLTVVLSLVAMRGLLRLNWLSYAPRFRFFGWVARQVRGLTARATGRRTEAA